MINALTAQEARELIARGTSTSSTFASRGNGRGASCRDPELQRDGITFVCAARVRSQTAAQLAEANGFGQLYNLVHGTRSWVEAGLPLVRD